jgi:lysophospholipid acyltransferase (LPLAT)-like uncharacterized protein
MWKYIAHSALMQRFLGWVMACYLRLVWYTSRARYEPSHIYDLADNHWPLILSMWHGQHFLIPFLRRKHDIAVLISKHRDGRVNARACEILGIKIVRGSGAHGAKIQEKGGIGAFFEMKSTLDMGRGMALTADVPKISRKAGLGIIKLAQYTGRPIFPVAVASSRFIGLKSWDKAALNLPFSTIAFVADDPIYVPKDADDAALEAFRSGLEAKMNDVTTRAYALANR